MAIMKVLSDFSLVNKRLGGRNLYLIGMMGSGKSITGPLVAKYLSYSFVDSDKVVESVVGKSIKDFFHENGETLFRDIESQVLNAIGQRHSLVVSTGGGVVKVSENWGVLHQGIVIWLNPSRDILLQRLKNDSGSRPLLDLQNFDALLAEREKFYREADVEISIDQESPDEIAQNILNNLLTILKDPKDPFEQQTTSDKNPF